MQLNINGRIHQVDTDPDTPLLWVLRDELGLTGTKYGCGVAACGACTVHLDGRMARSCQTRTGDLAGVAITTIEGAPDHALIAVVQQEWIAQQVAQCGYCQPGQIMAAAALLAEDPAPDDPKIDAAMSGNLCRCATYPRIRAAIHAAATRLTEG